MDILIADDIAEVRTALRLLLETEIEGARFEEAAQAIGLFVMVRRHRPGVILLDWELHRLKATRFLLMMRRVFPQVRVIALSCRPEAREEALQAGALFVSKGDSPEHLIRTVKNVISTTTSK